MATVRATRCRERARAASLLGLALWATGALAAQKDPLAIPYATVAAARKAVLAKPGVTQDEHEGWLVVTDQSGDAFTTWTFTPKGHAAHPALLRRDIVVTNGAPAVVMHFKCEAARKACDAFYARARARLETCYRDCTTVLP
jgi:hypothetical protein